MRLRTLYNEIDAVAPFALSEAYIRLGHTDNSGILLDCGREISGVLFSLDLTTRAAEEAKARGANCIVTHHPAIWGGVMRIEPAATPALAACVREGISVISAHLNLDAAEEGIDEWLMRGLGGVRPLAVFERVEGGCYGRVYDVKEEPLPAFAARAGRTFESGRVLAYGGGTVKRVASFCGAGLSAEALAFAKEEGADTVVSSDGKHHLVTEAAERGLGLVLLTHYAAENYGFVRFAEKIINRIGTGSCFTDGRFL